MKKSVKSVDAIIIGGGIIGLATSYELLRAGVNIICIYPKEADKEAASRAAGAMLGAFGEITADDVKSDIEEFEFRLAAQRYYPEWLTEIKDRSKLNIHQSKGTFIIANNDGFRDRAAIKRMKMEADRVHESADWVEPEEVPGLKPNPNHAPTLCLHLKNEHSVDSSQLLNALVFLIENSKNAKLIDDYVISVQQKAGGWCVTTKNNEIFSSPNVVLAAGSRSFEFLDFDLRKEAGLPTLYFGKGVSCLMSAAPQIPQTIRTPNRAFACGIHVVPRGSGHLYVGATNFLGIDHNLEAGIQPTELHGLFDETIHQINTDIRTSKIDHICFGYRPIAMFRRPIIGKTRLPGLNVATGTYRNGILMAPLVAEIIAAELGYRDTTHWKNPFSVVNDTIKISELDYKRLVNVGMRDIVSFLHEPRGVLPYNRAQELEKCLRVLFEMSVLEDDHYKDLRNKIRNRIEEAPFNETIHKLFYEIVDQV